MAGPAREVKEKISLFIRNGCKTPENSKFLREFREFSLMGNKILTEANGARGSVGAVLRIVAVDVRRLKSRSEEENSESRDPPSPRGYGGTDVGGYDQEYYF